jgi:ATP adenylyltransferase
MAYIDQAGGAKSRRSCFFCRLGRAKPSPENLVLATTPRVLVMLNLYPYNVGHVMVAPRGHTASLARLAPEESRELGEWLGRVETAIRRAYRPHGFNLGMNLGRPAGAGVLGHLHWHIVPRWNGDTNFMPVTAGTKVLPEALESTYRKLAKELATESSGSGPSAARRAPPRGR